MTYSNRGGGFGGGQNYSRRDFNDRGSDRPALFDAICAQCGAACKVPFRPNGRKEVFCSKCFEDHGGSSRDSGFGDSRRSNFSDKQMFRATCDQCGQGCEVPFRPTQGKPVLCSNCFAGSRNEPARPAGNIELQSINAKLDKIIKLLTPTETKSEEKRVAKEITEKILEEIEENIEKTPAVSKKKKVKKSTK